MKTFGIKVLGCMDGWMAGSFSSIPAAKTGLIVPCVWEPLNTSFKSD